MPKIIQFQVVNIPDNHSHSEYDQLWTLSDDGSIRLLVFPGVTDRTTLPEDARDWHTIKQAPNVGPVAG